MNGAVREHIRLERDRLARQRDPDYPWGNYWIDAAGGDGWLALWIASDLVRYRRPRTDHCVWCGAPFHPFREAHRYRECPRHFGLELEYDGEVDLG